MILEIMEITVAAGKEDDFLRDAASGLVAIFSQAKGCKGAQIRASPEAPSEFRLLVRWETLENHIVDFRQSEGVVAWRKLISPYFDGPPTIKNWTVAIDGFGLDI